MTGVVAGSSVPGLGPIFLVSPLADFPMASFM
jgi:hypothetical protein